MFCVFGNWKEGFTKMKTLSLHLHLKLCYTLYYIFYPLSTPFIKKDFLFSAESTLEASGAKDKYKI